MAFTIVERKNKLNRILELLQTSGYVYSISSKSVNGITTMPPPVGTKMNCESAARIFIQLAKDMGIDDLEGLYYKAPDEKGYFVPHNGKLALGCRPDINTISIKGWEFENHYRVRDKTTGIVYDPTFGTHSISGNLEGILGTTMTTDKLTFSMTTIYGEKYRVVRKGIQVEAAELTKSFVHPKYIINDASFLPKPMTNLR